MLPVPDEVNEDANMRFPRLETRMICSAAIKVRPLPDFTRPSGFLFFPGGGEGPREAARALSSLLLPVTIGATVLSQYFVRLSTLPRAPCHPHVRVLRPERVQDRGSSVPHHRTGLLDRTSGFVSCRRKASARLVTASVSCVFALNTKDRGACRQTTVRGHRLAVRDSV